MIKKILLVSVIIILVIGVLGVGSYFLVLPKLKTKIVTSIADNGFGWKFPVTKFPVTGSLGGLIAYSNIRDPGGVPQGLPVRLQIPGINVDSAIEDALITPDGRMDVPAGSVNVAWFALGPHPGQVGSAVIGGHFGETNGVPFVFYRLSQVKVGDKVSIIDDENNTLTFVVRRIQSFDRDADATTVFTSNDGLAHLNLITCEGIWNQQNGSYPQRLVLFTDLVAPEKTGNLSVKATVAGKPTLPETATLKTSATPSPAPSTISPIEQIASKSSGIVIPTLSNSLPEVVKSLFANAADSTITILLLALIVFVLFKIIRR